MHTRTHIHTPPHLHSFTYVAMFRGVDTVKTKAQQAYFNAHRAYSDVQHSTQHTAQHAAQQTHRNAGNADHVYSSQNDNDNDNAEYIQGREGSGSGGGRYDNEDEGGGGGGSRYDKEGNELRRDALTDAFEKLVSTYVCVCLFVCTFVCVCVCLGLGLGVMWCTWMCLGCTMQAGCRPHCMHTT